LGKPASLYATTAFLASNFYAGQNPKHQHRFLRRETLQWFPNQGNPTILTNQLAAMQNKFTTTFGQNNAKEFISNSETNEIEKLLLKSVYERAASKCF